MISSTAKRGLAGWVIGFGSSVLADQVFYLALAWAVVQLGTPELIGPVLAAAIVPKILILLFSGNLVDSGSPKKIIMTTDAGRALAMAFVAAIIFFGGLETWIIIFVALLVGTLDGFFLPAIGALPARIAPTYSMTKLSALRTVTQRFGILGGGPLAGWLIYLFGSSAAFAGAAVLFAMSVLSLIFVKLIDHEVVPVVSTDKPQLLARAWDEVSSGFRVLQGKPILMVLMIIIAVMNFGFSGPFTAGIPLLADGSGWGAKGAGYLIGAFGIGSAVSGFGLLVIKHIPRAGLTSMITLFFMGVSLSTIGLTSNYTVAMIASIVMGLTCGVFGTIAYGQLLQLSSSNEVGRVMGLLSLNLEGTAALSFLATGVSEINLSLGSSFLIGGLLILVTAVAGFARSDVRQLEADRSTAKTN